MRDNGGRGAQASSPSVCCPPSAASLRYSLGVMPVMVLNMREKYPGESNPHIVSISPIERDVSRRSLLATIILRWRMKRVVDMPVMFLMRRLSCERLVGTISASCWLLMVAQLIDQRERMRRNLTAQASEGGTPGDMAQLTAADREYLERIVHLIDTNINCATISSQQLADMVPKLCELPEVNSVEVFLYDVA